MGKDSKPKESSKGKGKQAASGGEDNASKGKGKGGKSGDGLGTCIYVKGCFLPFCSSNLFLTIVFIHTLSRFWFACPVHEKSRF